MARLPGPARPLAALHVLSLGAPPRCGRFWYVYVQRRAPPRARGGHLILIFGAARVCGFGAARLLRPPNLTLRIFFQRVGGSVFGNVLEGLFLCFLRFGVPLTTFRLLYVHIKTQKCSGDALARGSDL